MPKIKPKLSKKSKKSFNQEAITTPYGQWEYPGEITRIPGNTMRTDGYGDIPLYVVPNNDSPRIVYANTGNHYFPNSTHFTEYPMMQDGGLFSFLPDENTLKDIGNYIVSIPSKLKNIFFEETKQKSPPAKQLSPYDIMMEVKNNADNNFMKKWNASNFYDSYKNIKKPLLLKTGRFTGASVDPSMINELVKAAEKQKIDPWLMVSLAGRESTFGSGAAKNENRKGSREAIVSGWNVAENYQPYQLERFLADKKVPGVVTDADNHGWFFSISNLEDVNKYLKKHPELINEYKKKLESTPDIGKKTAYDLAAEFIKKRGVKKYNPGDAGYSKAIAKDMEILKKDKAMRSYMKSLGYKYGGAINNEWEIIGETNNFQKGGKVVSEIWQDVTGTPWSQAKKLGLTSGGYDENIKLRTELLKNPEKFAKEFGTKETPVPVRRPQQAPQPAGRMHGPFINQDTSGIKLPYPVSYNWSSAPNLSPTTNVIANDPYSTNVTASGRNIPKQPGFFENIVKGITDSELVKDVSDVIKSVRDIEDVRSSFERGLGKLGITRPGTEDVEPMIVETPSMQNVPPVKIDSSLAANNTATVDTTPTTYRQFSGIKDPKSGTQYGRYVNTFSNWKGQEYIPTKNVGQWKKDKTTKYPSNQMAHFLLDTDVSQGYMHEAAKKQIEAQKQGRSITAGSSLKEQWLPVYEDLGNGKIRVKYKTNKQLAENDKVLAPFRQYKYGDLDWEGQKKKSTWNRSSYAIKTKSGEESRIISSGKDDTGYGRFGGGSFVIIGKRKNGEEVVREMSGSVRDLKDQAKDLAKSLGQNVDDLVIGFHDVGLWSAKPSSSSKTLGFENFPRKNATEFETYQKDYTGAGLAFPLQKMGGKIKNSNFKEEEEEVMLPNLMEMAFGGNIMLEKYDDGGSDWEIVDELQKADNGVTVRKPIIVNNPNDPRLQAYNDSLDVYNKFQNLKKNIETTNNFPEPDGVGFFKVKGSEGESIVPNTKLGELFRLRDYRENFSQYNTGTQKSMKPIDIIKYPQEGWNILNQGLLPIYQKPVQPVVYQPRTEQKPNYLDSLQRYIDSQHNLNLRQPVIPQPRRQTQNYLRLIKDFERPKKQMTMMEPRKADFQTSPSLFSKRLSEPIFKKPKPKRAIAYKHDTDIPIEYEKRNGGKINEWEILDIAQDGLKTYKKIKKQEPSFFYSALDYLLPGTPVEDSYKIYNTFADLVNKRIEHNKKNNLPLDKMTPEEIQFREKVFQGTPDFGYPSIFDYGKISESILKGKKYNESAPDEKTKSRRELKKMWLGIDEPDGKNKGYWIQSEYKPKNSTNPNAFYYKPKDIPNFSNEEFEKLYNLTNKFNFPGNAQNILNAIFSKGKSDYSSSDISLGRFLSGWGGNQLGNFKLGAGEDEKGKYVSVYDVWDLFPPELSDKGIDIQQFGNSPEIYYRIYQPEYNPSYKEQKSFPDQSVPTMDFAFGGNIMLEKYDDGGSTWEIVDEDLYEMKEGGKKGKRKRQKAEPPYPIDSPLDMYGRPMLANPRIIPGLDRSFYDPRLNKINFGSDFTDADTYSKDKMMAHENYHAYQHANDMDTYLPVRDIPYAKPPMVSTDEYYSSYYNRKPIEVGIDIANFRQKNPSFNFVPDKLIYDTVVDYDQYFNPSTLEGSAKIYEDLGDEVPFEPIYKEGGKTPIWQRKEGKSPSGGLNAKGRASLKREGHDIKPPQPQGGPRKKSFCARSAGQMKMWPKAAKDPNSRLRLARKKWKC